MSALSNLRSDFSIDIEDIKCRNLSIELILSLRNALFTVDLQRDLEDTAEKLNKMPVSKLVIESIWERHSVHIIGYLWYNNFFNKNGKSLMKKSGFYNDGKYNLDNLILHVIQKNISSFLDDKLKLEAASEEELVEIQMLLINEHQAKIYEYKIWADNHHFFSYPNAKLENEIWFILPSLTVEESAALILGKDPRIVNRVTLAEVYEKGDSILASKFFDICLLLDRAMQSKKLLAPLTTGSLIEICRSHSIEISQDFLKFYQSNKYKIKSTPIQTDELILPTKSANSLYKMILYTAIEKYKFDTNLPFDEDQPGVFANFERDLHDRKLDLSQKTIRSHIKAAQKWAISNDIIKPPSGRS